MKNKYFSAFFYLFFDSKCTAKQTKRQIPYKKWLLHPVGLICLSKKIPEPFSCTEDIKNPVTNVADALQQIAGIDVRRRGTSGTKLIYIYGAEVLIKRCYL
jgi:iron complex outermembrane receptor protein